MPTIDKFQIILAILIISVAIYFVIYEFGGMIVISHVAVIIGIVGFFLGIYNFLEKSNSKEGIFLFASHYYKEQNGPEIVINWKRLKVCDIIF